jgi:DNA-binding CsgD family transcriptional regulator
MGSQPAKKFFNEAVTIHPETPWLDVNGKTMPDEYLKMHSQGWSMETWVEYLKSLETPMRETLISDHAFNQKLDQQSENFFERAQCLCPTALANKVSQAIERLSGRQSQILQMVFWQNLSEREVANQLGISRPSVQVMKKRAIKRLESILKEKINVIPFETLTLVDFSKKSAS